MKPKLLSPTRQLQPFGHSSGRPLLSFFGKYTDGVGWSPEQTVLVKERLKSDGVRTLILPNTPTVGCPTTRISQRRDFRPADYLPGEKALWVLNGAVSAGVILGNKNEAGGVFTTDPVAIVKFPTGRVIMLVCNEHTLLDRAAILEDRPSPNCTSAVHEAVKASHYWERHRAQVLITMRNSSAPHVYPWNDPKAGKFNQLMCQYVKRHFGPGCFKGQIENGLLNISSLAERQFVKWGIHNVSHDSMDLANPDKWWSPQNSPGKNNFVVCAL